MSLSLVVVALAAALTLLVVRLVAVLLQRPPPQRTTRPLAVCVVLGSGGHTAELMAAIGQLDRRRWVAQRPYYVVSNTDADSTGVAERFEGENRRRARVMTIPRAREVGQSYLTSVFTTLRALVRCLSVAVAEQPDVILTNGPGVCVPVVMSSMLLAALGIVRRPRVSYFESFTCVDHLSLTGRIMLHIADVFTIQWPQMRHVVGATRASIRYTGPFTDSADLPPLRFDATKTTALVTVGSTHFDELVAAVDTSAFLTSLRDLGIKEVLVQYGRGKYTLKTPAPDGLTVTAFAYRAGLAATIRDAALVVSHAGAGTILEALHAGVRTIVVPNSRLMSNHQLQLARALHERNHLFCVAADRLSAKIGSLPWESLRAFPKPSPAVTAAVDEMLQ